MNSASPPSRSRLARADRHQQLLDTALDIVRNESVDALTLARLAERAGVSKPIAYDHFTTRDGLLIELYKSIDHAQAQALTDALEAQPHDLKAAAKRVAATYMHCYADTTGEWHAVAGALQGSAGMETVHRELLGAYVDIFVSAFRPYTDRRLADLRLMCSGLVGAAEAISAVMVRGEVTEAKAAATLATMIEGVIDDDKA